MLTNPGEPPLGGRREVKVSFRANTTRQQAIASETFLVCPLVTVREDDEEYCFLPQQERTGVGGYAVVAKQPQGALAPSCWARLCCECRHNFTAIYLVPFELPESDVERLGAAKGRTECETAVEFEPLF